MTQSNSLLDDYTLQLGLLLDRRATERALVGARQNAERAARLAEDALRQAQQADRTKANFLANVTHELRTPLNAIIGFSEIIETGSSGADSTAYGQYIHAAGTRLLGIVNDVLTLTRIEADKLELDEQLVSLDEVLIPSIRSLASDAEEKSIAVKYKPEFDHAIVIDPGKMKQVFVRLLSNAIRFTEDGGVVLISAALNPRGALTIAIRDTGCGIPAEHLERVLEPFGQVEDHLTRESEGVGLGLPVARAMVQLHGGSLTLTSEVGVGTLVEITLPPERLHLPNAETPS